MGLIRLAFSSFVKPKLLLRSLQLLLLTSTALFAVGARADELVNSGVSGGFFVFTEQEVGWFKGDAEAAVTSARLGYAVEGPQLSLGIEAGPRYISQFNLNNRTDWSAKLEGAWVPKQSSLEFYGEYEPAISTEVGNRGLYQTATWGLVIPLSPSNQPQFDVGQDFEDASDLYLKIEQEGAWSVGGHQELILASPRLGYGFEIEQAALALEAGPSLRWSDNRSPHTDLAAKVDFRISPTDHYELFVEYEPTYIFQSDQPFLVQILRGGLVFSF